MMARSLLSSRCYRGLHATLRAVFIAAATLLTRECGSSRLNVRYSCAIPPRLLVLRGGGLGNWEEVSNALEDSRRELTVDVEDGCTYLGDKLFQCSSLQRLVIKGGLAALPQEIGRLGALTTLILSGNKLTCLPNEIGQLENLRVLEMEHNELSSLPSSAANLAKLEVLNVANNKLSSLAVLATPSLTHLNADNNAISDEQDLPSLSHLPRLKHLSLAHNGLTSIPREIGKLQMLESLNIAGNQLQKFPAEMADLREKTLKILDFDDNPLIEYNRLIKIKQKSKKPIKDLLEHIRKSNSSRQQAVATSKVQSTKKKNEKADTEEDDSDDAGKAVDKRNGETGDKNAKKMSRRQQHMHQEALQAAQKDTPRQQPVGVAALTGKIAVKNKEKRQSSQEESENDDDDTDGDDSTNWSSSTGGERGANFGGNEAGHGAQGGGETEMVGHTGVRHKTTAEIMVENGEAENVEDARLILRKRLGMMDQEGGAGGGKKDGKSGKRGGGFGPRTVSDAFEQEVIIIKTDHAGRLIGRQGATVKKISKDSGARIDVKKEDFMLEGQMHSKVIVSGTNQAIQKAKSAMKDADVEFATYQ